MDGHKDVPETVCEELYMEEQQILEKSNRKGGYIVGNGVLYRGQDIDVDSNGSLSSLARKKTTSRKG